MVGREVRELCVGYHCPRAHNHPHLSHQSFQMKRNRHNSPAAAGAEKHRGLVGLKWGQLGGFDWVLTVHVVGQRLYYEVSGGIFSVLHTKWGE